MAAVFLCASVPKIASPHEFALAIYRYHLLGDSWVNVAAIYIPWLEASAAVFLLLIPRFRQAAVFVLGVLLTGFTVVLATAAYRGINIPCGCFSVSSEAHKIGIENFLQNGVLLTALASCWFSERWLRHKTPRDAKLDRPASPAKPSLPKDVFPQQMSFRTDSLCDEEHNRCF